MESRFLGIDVSVGHPARVYDYWLGWKANFAADRDCRRPGARRRRPGLRYRVRANRAFLGRAVRYLAAEAGIRQFLDLGTGIPSADNTHEVAQAIAPKARVVYVDNDPIVLAHASRALLTGTPQGAGRLPGRRPARRPAEILAATAPHAGLQPAGRPDDADGPAHDPRRR